MNMTEKEKRDAGMLYNPNVAEILDEIQHGREVCHEYNALHPSAMAERERIIRTLFGKTGSSLMMQKPFYFDSG